MGSVTDARIAGWQKEAGIEPATGKRAEALAELSRQAYELIQVIELERSGIRDGAGSWIGSNALEGTIDNLNRCWPPLSSDDSCPRCGAHMQATHHPLCEAKDGTPTGLANKNIRPVVGTEAANVIELADNAEIKRIRAKLNTALESTDYGWGTELGDLVGGELTDMLEGRAHRHRVDVQGGSEVRSVGAVST